MPHQSTVWTEDEISAALADEATVAFLAEVTRGQHRCYGFTHCGVCFDNARSAIQRLRVRLALTAPTKGTE